MDSQLETDHRLHADPLKYNLFYCFPVVATDTVPPFSSSKSFSSSPQIASLSAYLETERERERRPNYVRWCPYPTKQKVHDGLVLQMTAS